LSPTERYAVALQTPGMLADPAQATAIESFERLWRALSAASETQESWFGKLFGRAPEPIRGLYLYGGVGRGKTWLMDLFFAALDFPQKLRLHFHDFMARVHHDLRLFANEEDPLELVALKLAKQARVICFDEFFVSDIGDAMILGRLLDALFERHVVLVATSNARPDQLYRDGLQRAQFLPAIALIERECEVLELSAAQDFRRRVLDQAQRWLVPHDERALSRIDALWERLHPALPNEPTTIQLNDRPLKVRAASTVALWVLFSELCEAAWGPEDYVRIARQFSTVIVEDIPLLDRERENAARRLISLIDALYDRGTKLIASADAPIDALYRGDRLKFEFARTQSRLTEMQSTAYLDRALRKD
jgi:cell division protein ZapE